MENNLEWNFKEIYKDEKEFEDDIELLEKQTEEIIKLKNKHVKDTLLGLMEYLRLREK